MKKNLIELTTPGEILKEEFIDVYGMKYKDVAQLMEIPISGLWEIIHGKRSITVDTALCLSRLFNTTPEFWLNLQNNFDLEQKN